MFHCNNHYFFLLFSSQPERLEGSEYSVQSDIWSLGLSLVEMAIGLYPIPAPSPNHVDRLLTQSKPTYHEQSQSLSVFDMMECIIDDAPPRVEHESMSPEFTNFVDSCLKKDPKERGDLNVLLVCREFFRLIFSKLEYFFHVE